MTTVLARTEKLDLRISRTAKQTLRAAAQASAISMSDFVIASALARANEIMADRRLFILSPDKWKAFEALLDSPEKTMPRVGKLLRGTSFFE